MSCDLSRGPSTFFCFCYCLFHSCITVNSISVSVHYIFLPLRVYVPIYCVGVEEDILSCQNDSTMHQQWFVSLIRQSEVTLIQPLTSISPFCGYISERYIVINRSKSTGLFWSKQSPYKISLSASIDAHTTIKKFRVENIV